MSFFGFFPLPFFLWLKYTIIFKVGWLTNFRLVVMLHDTKKHKDIMQNFIFIFYIYCLNIVYCFPLTRREMVYIYIYIYVCVCVCVNIFMSFLYCLAQNMQISWRKKNKLTYSSFFFLLFFSLTSTTL
jgi:hypothetical protein